MKFSAIKGVTAYSRRFSLITLKYVFLSVIILLSGCCNFKSKDIYANAENWVIRDSAIPLSKAKYDIFYVYPTLVGKADGPEMEWADNPKVCQKVKGFVEAQTHGIFGEDARIFAPYVHQLTYKAVMEVLSETSQPLIEIPQLRHGMLDTVAAFRHYLKYDNQRRPFILLGHSQGAMNLYFLLKHCHDISPQNGFVAAYLAGLPHVTETQIRNDFQGRVQAGQNATDLGVILIWNTQNREATSTIFTGFGEYCINPLNWRTDATPADRSLHRLARIYDYRDSSVKEFSHLFSAVVNPEKGALFVDLPSQSEWDANAFMGKGVFHVNDIWFYAGNLKDNAMLRVSKYLERR